MMIDYEKFVRMIIRQERLEQLLDLEELVRLNQRLTECAEGRFPRPQGPELLEPRAVAGLLRLVYDRVNLRSCLQQDAGRMELRLTNEQVEKLFREALQADERLKLILERMAAVIGLTYAELGDGAPLADDEALDLIRGLLLDYDEQIITRSYQRGHQEIIKKRAGERNIHA
jgi:hypothetical protein